MQIHEFDSTGEAYDASQCSSNIKFGDILVVKAEKVVGFLLSAWPVAVTKEHGAFHTKHPAKSWADVAEHRPSEQNHPDYHLSVAKAIEIAKELGFE